MTTDTAPDALIAKLESALSECRAHAVMALLQRTPSDDAVIMAHVEEIARVSGAALKARRSAC